VPPLFMSKSQTLTLHSHAAVTSLEDDKVFEEPDGDMMGVPDETVRVEIVDHRNKLKHIL